MIVDFDLDDYKLIGNLFELFCKWDLDTYFPFGFGFGKCANFIQRKICI